MPGRSADQGLDQWRAIFERLGTTVWIWNTKTDAVEFTENWLASLGYDDDKIKTSAAWYDIIHPDERDKVSAQAKLCVDGAIHSYEQEYRIRKADGTYQWFISRAQVFKTEQSGADEDMFMVGVLTDTGRMQAALRTSEKRWVEALDGSSMGVWDWDLMTNEVYFSPEWIRMLNYVDGDLEPSIASWRKVVLPEDLVASDRAIQQYLAGETDEYRCECRVQCKDGSIKWILDRGKVSERSPEGEPIRLVGTHDDITELKTHEGQISEAHARLERITAQAPGMVYKNRRYPDGRSSFPFTSSGIRKLFGVESEQVVDSASPLWEKIHPDDRERIIKTLADRDGNPQFRSFEYRVVKPDGEIRWLRNDANPKKSKETDGSRLWYGHISDVTNEKIREQELRSQRDRLDLITNLIPGALYEYMIHRDGSVSIPFASERVLQIFGVSAEEVIKDPAKLRQNIAPQFLGPMEKGLKMSIETGVEFDEEYQVVVPNGELHWVRARATHKKNPEGDSVLYAYAMDITASKHADLALQRHADALGRANEDLEQFNYVAVHDLKEPLRSIRHLAEWIEEDLPGDMPEAVAMNLNRMRERVEKLQALIDALAEFSRVGRLDVKTETLSIASLVTTLVADFDTRACRINTDLVADITIDTARVALDAVLKNLLNNALAHHDNPKDIQITVSAELEGNSVAFEVSDNGPGIAPEHHDRVFRIYQRLNPESNPNGTGSGLAIIKRILDSIGSKICIEANENGRGAKFCFDWPIHWPKSLGATRN